MVLWHRHIDDSVWHFCPSKVVWEGPARLALGLGGIWKDLEQFDTINPVMVLGLRGVPIPPVSGLRCLIRPGPSLRGGRRGFGHLECSAVRIYVVIYSLLGKEVGRH